MDETNKLPKTWDYPFLEVVYASILPPVQFNSVAQACPTLCNSLASLSLTNSQSLLRLISIELVMPSNHLILCCPLLLPPSIFPSIRVFSNESVLRIRWPKDQRILLRVPWTARRSNKSILKESSPEYSLEGLMLKLKLQSFPQSTQHMDWYRSCV